MISWRVCLPVFVVITTSAGVQGQDWPQFRGPTGQGHSAAVSLPLTWSDDSENIAWKTPIDGLGWSSPTVSGDKIWLTTATEEGISLRAVCLNLATGKVLHDVEVFRREAAGKIHNKNSHASPTPIIVDDHVFVHFGTYGTACVMSDGRVKWRKNVDYRHVHGPGGSPVVHKDSLIFSCDGGNQQFVVALDTETGEEKWRTDRPENPYAKKFAFSTPLLVNVDGHTEVVSPGAGGVSGYDPADGKQLWRVDYPEGYSVIPRPVLGQGLLFVSSSYDRPVLHAIRIGGRGNVTDTHVAWKMDRGAPHTPSTLLVDEELYVVSDRGVATCVDAKTGEQHWQQRLGGNFSASPLYAAGRIYFTNETGVTTVVGPGKEFQELAVNEITGRTLASLTPVTGGLLLRTDTHLMMIKAE